MVAFTHIAAISLAVVTYVSAVPVTRGDTSYEFNDRFAQVTFNRAQEPIHGSDVNALPSTSMDFSTTKPHTSSTTTTDAVKAKLLWSPARLAIFIPTRYIYSFKMR